MIKKAFSFFLAILLFSCLLACVEQKEVVPPSLSTPEEACESFCRALKASDLSAASGCLLFPQDIGIFDLSGEQSLSLFMPYFREWTGKLEYTVHPASSGDGNARVKVDYRYADASSVLAEAARVYLQKAKDMGAEGKDDSEIEAVLPDVLTECAKTASLGQSALTVEYELVQGGGEWKIKNIPEELTRILTADLFLNADTVASDLSPYLPAS